MDGAPGRGGDGSDPPRVRASVRRSNGLTNYLFGGDVRNWPVLIVVVLCLAVFAMQELVFADEGTRYAFSSEAMARGRWWTIMTALFLHGGIVHILSNMSAYITLAPWVVARFGGSWKALVPYHVFFLLCGLAGNLTFWLIHPHGATPVLGASGAIYGVYAAMTRLDPRQQALTALWSRQTLKACWFFLWSNALVIVLFGGPAMLGQLLAGRALDIPIAWEAHLGGFVSGFFLIQLMAGKGWPQTLVRAH